MYHTKNIYSVYRPIIRLHRMHEMLTILTDVCNVCLSVTWRKSAVAHAVYAACPKSFGVALSNYYDHLLQLTSSEVCLLPFLDQLCVIF